MSIDRDARLKKAEKLLRQGKLDGAIEEYVRLVDEQPRDWNAINALGDLYVRAGQVDHAVVQFTRIADLLNAEGFYPKAAALYRKILKVKSDDEATLVRLSEVAVRQGLLADAKVHVRQLAQVRRSRGDVRGAAECLIRLGALDDADADAKLAAGRAAATLGEAQRAKEILVAAAGLLERQNRRLEALDALSEAAELDPDDVPLRARLGKELLANGQAARASRFVTRESAAADPDLLMALCRLQVENGEASAVRPTVTRLLSLAPERHLEVALLAEEFAAKGQVAAAFDCVDVVAEAALLEPDFQRAVDVLDAFTQHVQHPAALAKLVEVCVDAGFDERMREAQAQLADVYLDRGQGVEARVIAEDLVAYDPASRPHMQRLRRALELLQVEDADLVLARHLFGEESLDEDLGLGDSFEITEPPHAGSQVESDPRSVSDVDDLDLASLVAPAPVERATVDPLEVDLSETLADLHQPLESPPVPAAVSQVTASTASSVMPPVATRESPIERAAPPRDLDGVFAAMRAKAAGEPEGASAIEQFSRAQEYLRLGRVREAITQLHQAARAPHLRFQAASQLGRLHLSRNELPSAIDWFEYAAESPAPTTEDGLALLYDLGEALERSGESARALAVLLELAADDQDFRDVRARIARLSRAQSGGGRS